MSRPSPASWAGKSRSDIHSSGYVVHRLEAALWSVARAQDFRDAVLTAANLGDDADTVAAVTGQLAGALWGAKAIPAEWVERLARSERMRTIGAALHAAAPSKRAAPTLNDRAIRLMIANFMEGHWVFRTIFDSGAPKLEATEIVGPIAVPSTSGKEVAYCASARVVLSRRKAFVRLVQQPDGKVNVHTQVLIDQGPCGDKAKPFPELERARGAAQGARQDRWKLNRTDWAAVCRPLCHRTISRTHAWSACACRSAYPRSP